jgi:hypothetical protein
MSVNPNASADTLSESQQQLLKSVQQLQEEQRENISTFATAADQTDKKKTLDRMKQNETLQTQLLSSLGRVALVQTQEVDNRRNAAKELAILVELAEQELQDVRARLDTIQTTHSAKKRMIELNTYYGKRFMAQAGVMKIFIYMCIPVLVFSVLANMGLLPNYIAGFIIIAIIVAGIVYIYAAVHDINRRDKMNFDEYTWEFDPSRVGSVINPKDATKRHRRESGMDIGCFNGECCDKTTTTWNPASKSCVVQDAQGGGSKVKGENVQTTAASASAHTTSLLGDLKTL